MIKFLIQRPIAVLMAFTACFIIGLVTYNTLPISLLPDIAIPEITIQVSAANTSARELENTIVKPLRGQLIQVSTLKDIHSESRDGAGMIHLSFDFGTNTDLAFIEVNEKIDAAMNYLPKDTERPKVIKASATDIPVFYLNLTLKNDSAYSTIGQQSFLDLCEFAESVIKRRIEQLEEVAMVDVTGLVERQVQIVPDEDKLAMMGFSIEDIESALAANNVEPGSMTVRDGYYEYNIKFSTLLRTAEDVKNIYLRKGDRIVQLKDFCKVTIVPVKEKGVSVSNGKRAVTLAVIKQADENMDKMKQSLVRTMEHFRQVYPDIDFSISRNQTELLDYTISNLQQNLTLGFLFICLVAVLSPEEIDEINILRASFLAMHRAVDQLTTRPQHLLIDGNRFTKYPGIPHTTVVKGDGKFLSIAAASILAKTYRDDYMNRLHEEFPYYDWDHNKGYPTKKHRAAIAERGTTPYHRMTFNLLGDGQLTLNF